VSLGSRIFHEVSLQFFLDAIPPGSRVLDCGAGDGAVSIPLARKGCTVEAIDMKAERIAKLDAAKGALPVTGHVGDVLSYPFPAGAYDYVISRQFLSRFPDRLWQVLKRKAELCRRGGAVIFHLHSAENVALSRELAAGAQQRAAVERGYSNDAKAGRAELENFCRQNSLVLEKLTPLSFFVPTAILFRAFLGEQALAAYAAEYERRLENPAVYDFVKWFESAIVAEMPLALPSAHVAVLRRA
jgi:2-polyprenyl-3-methyl-5-hydroxy-6-metoxy-1,4-benzoquinol methylase